MLLQGWQCSCCCYGDFSHQSPLSRGVRRKEEFQEDKGGGLGRVQCVHRCRLSCLCWRPALWMGITLWERCLSCKKLCGDFLIWSGAEFNLKPLHSVFAVFPCTQPFESTLSLASSDDSHHTGLVCPSLGSVGPGNPYQSCSHLLAWGCRTVPGRTHILPCVTSSMTLGHSRK